MANIFHFYGVQSFAGTQFYLKLLYGMLKCATHESTLLLNALCLENFKYFS